MMDCRVITRLLAFGVLAGSAGCMVHRPAQTVEPTVRVPGAFQQAPVAREGIASLRQPWWVTFEDPILNDLMETALAQNLELQQLVFRIEQADALYRQAGARLYPNLSGSASYDAVWRDLDDQEATTFEDSATAGALLNWEVDVWGRLRSAKGAQEQERQATYYDWLGGRLLLTAIVAETYFELLEQREQLGLLRKQMVVNETLLELNQLRFGQGLSSIVDVLQQQQQLDNTHALIPQVEGRAGQLQYTLDVLLGRAPTDAPAEYGSLPHEPAPFLATGVPSDLLLNRPDLVADRSRITALDYRVGEAIADRLPRVEIGGTLSAMGDPSFNSLLGSAFAGIVGPLFDGGERRAEVDLQRARLQEAIAEFSNNYLGAVRDVEVALVLERKQAEQVELQQRQLNTATRLLTETRNRYSQGLTDYLPVLAAITTEQNLQREVITSRRELLSRRVALYRALGGPMPVPAELAYLQNEQ